MWFGNMDVGVVGIGAMGQNHARVYSEIEGCRLKGIVDSNKEVANKFAAKYNTKALYDYRELLNEGVEAVSIAVPTSLHCEVASFFLENGVDCLVEKPIASTLEEGRKMAEMAKKKGVKLMIGHIERFNPAVQEMKKIIDDGILGKILIISSRRVGPFAPRIVDVGIIIDLATHDIDIARYFCGREPSRICSICGSIKHSKEDHAILLLDFDGVSASIEVNWFTPHKVRTAVVTGTDGIAYLDYIDQHITIYNSKWKKEPKIEKAEPLRKEIEHFIYCIKNDKEPLVDGNDALKTLEVAIKATQVGSSKAR